MRLPEAIATLRMALDDTGGAPLATTGASGAITAPTFTVPVDNIAVMAKGMYVVLGTGIAREGHWVADVGASSVTVTPAVAANFAANTPISPVFYTDDDYAAAIRAAVAQYSRYRPLIKPYTLSLVAGTDTYSLPADFIEPDRESFDAAIGLTSDARMAGSIYSLIYAAASRFQASGFGSAANWGGSHTFGFAPMHGHPADNPNGGAPQAAQTTFTFIRSATPSVIVKPAPTVTGDLEFFYKARHVVPTASADTTIPEEDIGLALLYAKYLRCEALATGKAAIGRYKLENEEIHADKGADQYRGLAKAALDAFNANVVMVGMGSLG